MTDTIRELLIDWLSRGNSSHKKILSQCTKIERDSTGKLILDCSKEVWETILEFSQKLDWLATGKLITDISLSIDGVEQNCFSPESIQTYPSNRWEQVDMFGLQLAKKFNFDSGAAIAVVEMGTNTGIFCTKKINELCRIPDECWREQDMGVYHIPEEYRRFIEALETHTIINNFEFHAKTGDGLKYWQKINGYLGMFGHRRVRVIEVADYQILG